MKYKTGYQLDGWGRFIASIEVRENPRKTGHYPCSANTVFEKPPKTKKYESAVWNGENWKVTPDFMGHEFYNKKTAERYEKEIRLGDVIDLKEWTEERPDGRFIWQYYNDLTGVWEENTVKKAEAEKTEKLESIKHQMTNIDIKNLRNVIAMLEGTATEKDREYYSKYRQEMEFLRKEYNKIKEG